MRILSAKILDSAGLEAHERLFVEFWYSMTHMRSLDSHRVRCLNSRTVVRELADEFRNPLLKPPELEALCAEAAAILRDDPIVARRFAIGYAVVGPMLQKPPSIQPHKNDEKKKEKETEKQKQERERFGFAIDDLRASLEADYFTALCDELREVIKPENADEIKSVVDSLLSDLLDQGWTLESLYHWHKLFLPDRKKAKRYSFDQCIDFMVKRFGNKAQEFEVIFRLSGSEKLKTIGAFGKFTISQQVEIDDANEVESSFISQNPLVTFARQSIEAVDERSAAREARIAFEKLLDLLRFEYEQSSVEIDESCLVTRCGDEKRTLHQIRHAVPNPVEGMEPDDFLRFVSDLDGVMQRDDIHATSKRHLQAAIRQYRFGRDSEGYKDKFLNWWMGLEGLCHVGRGKGIGPEVTRNGSRAMMQGYLFKLLRDLATTLKYCRIEWTEGLRKVSGSHSLAALSVSQLLSVLQSEQGQTALWKQCADHPVVVWRGKQLGACLMNAVETASVLERHLLHLEWHMHRLYRIRCCVVHGSPVRFKLDLYTANLEYYLKRTILFVMESFRENNHIGNLGDLFARASIAFDRTVDSLKRENAGDAQVREAVYAGVVVQEQREQ